MGFDLDYYVWTTVPLDASGKATYTPPIKLLSVGQHSMVASYLGDSNTAPSAGGMIENVILIPTTTTLTAATNSVQYGTPVTFNISVAGTPPTPLPTGDWTLYDGGDEFGVELGQGTLDSRGHASFTTSTLSAGAHTIGAYYFDRNYLHQSSSALMTETILPPGTLPHPELSPVPGTYTLPQSIRLSDLIAGTTIYYTTDRSSPTTNSAKYTGRFSISKTTTIKVFAVKSGYTKSAVISVIYNIE